MKARVTFAVFCVLALCASLPAQVFRLKNGRYVLGKIDTSHPPTEDGLAITRLDNGGHLKLTWKDLAAPDARRLREQYQLIDPNRVEQHTLPALRVVWTEEGRRREVTGLKVANDGEFLHIRVKSNTYRIRIVHLRSVPEPVDVPILDVLTPDQIYTRKLSELNPGEDADKHAKLAVYLFDVADYERARTHLVTARKLGGGAQPARIEGLLAKAEKMIKHREEARLLGEINTLRNRGQFKEALEKVKEFEQRFPDSPLATQFENAKRLLEASRESFLVKKVTESWVRAIGIEATRLAVDKSKSLDAVREFIEGGGFSDAIKQRIAKGRGISPEEVDAYFAQRIERKAYQNVKASYGFGSWLLSKKDLAKGAEKYFGKSKSRPKDGEAKRKRELKKRVRDFYRKARGQGGKATKQREITPDQWWKRTSTSAKRLWITAYYLEKGGDLEFVAAALRTCPSCGGLGYHVSISVQGGGQSKTKCETCHGTRFQRTVRYR
ncbi:MAG: hypothetical protein ACE5F1_19190 [Planctomycetota bacterium]